MVLAVVLQTTLFAVGRIQPFGAAPNIVLLAVIATVRYMEPEPGLLVGFTAGLLVDLLGGSPLGLWAMVLTVIAYLTLQLRGRAADGAIVIGVGVFVLTAIGGLLFVLVGTLFGQKSISNPALVKKMLLPGMYNVFLAAAVLPGVSRLLRPRERSMGSWAE